LTEAAINLAFDGRSNSLTRQLQELRLGLQKNAEGLSPAAAREENAEKSRQAAAVLPSAETLEKILRYETKLGRQMYRAMAQLERLQRLRQGEAVPAPMAVVAEGA
jgi:hypothetical protein